MSDIKKWLDEGGHVPPFLRDFHDQKDLFKALDSAWGSGNISWVEGQVYVIDFFLRWMAVHGYTLQRCRAKQDFENIHVSIDADRAARAKDLAESLKMKNTPND